MKAKRFLSILLTLCLMLGMVPSTALAVSTNASSLFTDVQETDWFYDAVQYTYENGLMSGTGEETFSPDLTTTRSMIVTILHRMEGVPSAADANFTDIPRDQWYTSAVDWASANDIVAGYGNGEFGPNDPITREQMAAILYRYGQYKEYDTTAAGDVNTFADGMSVSAYAVDAMNWAVGIGLLSGIGNNMLDPTGSATRAQAAMILMRFCEQVISTDTPASDTYTVTFEYNYGNKGVYETAEVNDGDTVDRPDNPSRSGYSFSGWYTKATGGGKFDFDNAISKNTILYAHWNAFNSGNSSTNSTTVTYTVDFDSNGGSAVESQIVPSESQVFEPEDPEKPGYVFTGWKDENGNYFEFDEAIYQDTHLTADWLEITSEAEEIFDQKIQELIDTDDSGSVDISLPHSSDNSPITNVKVSYVLDDIGTVALTELIADPMCGTAGLLGYPIEISSVGGDVKEATIEFSYDPSKVDSPNDLAIVWYDEENNITTLLENSVVDLSNHTVSVSTTHFSKYGVVLRQLWNEAWDKDLPTIRTEEAPYYNIILAMDRSSSMSGDKIEKSIQAAQNFVDILAEQDCLSVLTFTSSVSILTELVTITDSSKQEIKNTLATISTTGGTDIEEALQATLNYANNDPQYQSLVILLSDGQSNVNDSVLQELSNNEQRVITVGIGNDVDQDLMQRIADITGGSYVFCEDSSDLADAFIDLQNIYIGSTKDTDQDGLPDLVEISGMRDQYGEIWQTDPQSADSDGDGLLDGEEMGNYHALAEHTYFSRVSRPDLYTVKSDEAYLLMPENMMYGFLEDNRLILITYVTDARYRMAPDLLTPMEPDGIPKEYIYSAPQNLKVEVLNKPATFKLEEISTVAENTYGYATSYKTTAVFSYTQTTEWDAVTWRVTADNCSEWCGYAENGIKANYIETTQSIQSVTQTQDNMTEAKENWIEELSIDMAGQAYDLVQALTARAENQDKILETSVDDALSRVKEQVRQTPTISGTYIENVPDGVYRAIAQAILEVLDSSTLEKYESDPIKLTNQISTQIKNGLVNFNNKSIRIENTTYILDGNVWSYAGIGVSFLTVRWDGQSARFNWASEPEEIADAIANYCTALAQLNNEVWKDFISCYISDTFGLAGFEKITKANVDRVLDTSEKVIRALCDKDDANALIQEMNEIAKEKLKSTFLNKFKSFIKDNIPGGNEIVNAAEKYQKAKEKFERFQAELMEFQDFQNESDVKKLNDAYSKYLTQYQSLEEMISSL